MDKPARRKGLDQKKLQKVTTRKASPEQTEGTVVAEAEVVDAVVSEEGVVVDAGAVEAVAEVAPAPESTTAVEKIAAPETETAPVVEESVEAKDLSVSEARVVEDEVERLLQKIKMEVTFSDKRTIVKEIYLSEEEAKEALKQQEMKIPEPPKPPEDTKMPWVTVVILSLIVCASLSTGFYHWYSSYVQPPHPVQPAYVDERVDGTPANEPESINENVTDESNEPETPEVTRPRIEPPPEFAMLWAQHSNEDIVAVLTLGETEFTVVQGDDNAFYMTHDINRAPSPLGWVFLDSQVNLLTELDHNLVIYDPVGGIMRDAIQEYAEYDFFLKFPTISFSTIYGDMDWEIFSYYVAPSDFPFDVVNHPNDDVWGDIIDQFTLASLYNTRLNVNMDDQVLTIVVPTGIDPELFYILQARMLRHITS